MPGLLLRCSVLRFLSPSESAALLSVEVSGWMPVQFYGIVRFSSALSSPCSVFRSRFGCKCPVGLSLQALHLWGLSHVLDGIMAPSEPALNQRTSQVSSAFIAHVFLCFKSVKFYLFIRNR